MTSPSAKASVLAVLAAICIVGSPNLAGIAQAAPPVKLVLADHITGFEYPEDVAVNNDPTSARPGDIYVADQGRHRVDELTASGMLVAMFGMDVNETTKGNVCTVVSGDICKAGVAGTGAGAFSGDNNVAVDPDTGDVYVGESSNSRVDEYTPEGVFVLMFGKEVNQAKDEAHASAAEENVCKAGEACKAGVLAVAGKTEHGALYIQGSDDLAIGPAGLIYVAGEHNVQEFTPDGAWAAEIALTAIPVQEDAHVVSIAVNQESGELYLAYGTFAGSEESVVHRFGAEGKEIAGFPLPPREGGAIGTTVTALALNAAGDLAVAGLEARLVEVDGREHIRHIPFGSLYSGSTMQAISSIQFPSEESQNVGVESEGLDKSLAFSSAGDMYAAYARPNGVYEVLRYESRPIAEVLTGSTSCKPGLASGSSATFVCALGGQVNPESISETEVWYQWGVLPSLGSETSKVSVATGAALMAVPPVALEGLRPNQKVYYRLAANDQNLKSPEDVTGTELSFGTPVMPPAIVGEPKASFVTSSSAVLSAELNPQNTNTTYEFQYAPTCLKLKEVCPGATEAAGAESAAYGQIGATAEISGLQPSTTYRYRLVASNEELVAGQTVGGSVAGNEGSFTTVPAPTPQVTTGSSSAVGVSGATISGSVDPGGQAATYAFELGVYQGAQTQYGVVFSGPAGESTTPVDESLALSGLQPGTTYAYRIEIASGYTPDGQPLLGEAMLFKTEGVPAVLSAPASLPMLAIPAISFPKAVGVGSTKSKKAATKKKTKSKKKTRRYKAKKGTKAQRRTKARKSGTHGADRAIREGRRQR